MQSETGRANGALGWTIMPRPNRRLTELALRTAAAARPLLDGEGGLFMGLEVNAEGMLHLIWWRSEDFTHAAAISAEPMGFCPPDTAEGALQESAADLLDYLAGRWPAPPDGFGVITDGTGVAFAPDHPAPSAPDWLHRQAASEKPLIAIIPLDPQGPCALLRAPQTRRVH